jgi:hypothetical protein
MATSRRRLPLFLATGLFLLAWAVFAGYALLSANRDVRRGMTAIDRARGRVDASAVVEGRLIPDLRLAGDRFEAAHRRVAGPLLWPLRVVPVAGRQVRSVIALADAATEITTVAIAGMSEAQPVLAEPGASNTTRASSARRLGELAAKAQAELAEVRLGPREGLVAPLARARNRLSEQLAELRAALGKGANGGRAVAGILEGPRRYLLLAANNSEMRAGSGMLLNAGELETGPDGIRLNAMRSVTEVPVPRDAVPLTGELADRWGWLEPNIEWRNLMSSPRFDVAAPLASQMWVAAANRPVDGVMSLDPLALRGFLSATGPVQVDGRSIHEGNVEEELLHAQYLRFPASEDNPERREGLGRIAMAVFEALDKGSWSLPRLASGLARAGGGRHLLMWSADAQEQSAWQSLGVDGSLRPESLLVSVLNRGANKLDRFLGMKAEITASAEGDQTDATVTIHLDNHTPVGEPTYVAGPSTKSGVGEGVYLGVLTVNLPGEATNARFEGVETLAVFGRDGPSQVMGFQFELPRDGRRTFVARFRLPTRNGSLRVEPSARVPGITWESAGRSWNDDSPKILTWTR